jgi:hypothetical protein
MKKTGTLNLNDLLLPLGDKVGAIQKVSGLITELQHPNIDWKYVVSGIRTYLYDYVYDIPPYCDRVLPILFHYIKEATLRKKASALRASDTFIDRLTYVVNNIDPARKDCKSLREYFFAFALEYLDLLIIEGKDGYYFDSVNTKVLALARALRERHPSHTELIEKIVMFIQGQYGIYCTSVITADEADIEAVRRMYTGRPEAGPLLTLLESVLPSAYERIMATLETLGRTDPGAIVDRSAELLDFTGNSRTWERICVIVKKSIEDSAITDEDAIIYLLEDMIVRSNSGFDRDLQLFMSRTVASVWLDAGCQRADRPS